MGESFLSKIETPKPTRTTPPAPRKNTDITTPYGKAVLESKCGQMRATVEGTRNETLRDIGRLLGGFVGGGEISWNDAHDELWDAAVDSGLDLDEVEQIPRHLEYGMQEPLAAPEKPAPAVSIQDGAKVAENGNEGGGITPARLSNASQFKSRLLSPTDLQNLPEPVPLIEDVLDRGTTGLLFGRFGSCKSFISLDWAACVASGKAWQGQKTEQAKVLYVVAEGVAGFSGRLEAWQVGWRAIVDDEQIAFLPVPVNLMTQDVDRLAEEIHEGGFEFVILDTIARCTVGADENSAKDVGVVIDSMSRLVDATPNHQGMVLGIHHAGKGGQLRGSSAYEAGVDTVYSVERNGDIYLRCTKRKDGPDDYRHRLRLSPIDGTDSCIVETVSGDTDASDAAAVNTLKKIMTEMFADTGVSNTDLRAVAEEQGLSPSLLYRARAELLRGGWMVNNGSNNRPHWQVRRPPPATEASVDWI